MIKCILLTFLLTLSACDSLTKVESEPRNRESIVGKSLKAYNFKDIYFSSQPSDDDFKELKKQGFTHIVNLRQKREKGYSEAGEANLVNSLGIKYHNIPYTTHLSDAQIEKVTQAVVKYRNLGKTLVHCGRGSRAALWAGGHFFKDHKYSLEESFKIAKELGLREQKAIAGMDEYLKHKVQK